MQTYDVYFLGELMPGADPAAVQRDVAELFKIPADTAGRLFSGKALRVKQAVDVDTASRYREAFRNAGALVQIVPTGDPPPSPKAPAAPTQTPSPSAATAAADNSGQGMTLAAPGATIDDTPEPPPAQIDIGELSAMPANSGTLEDCKVDKPPHPIPDISHLEIVDD